MTIIGRCWLVERSLEDGRIISTIYATEDGRHRLTRQQAVNVATEGVPASIEIVEDELEPIDDPEVRSIYRAEAKRMKKQHGPRERV